MTRLLMDTDEQEERSLADWIRINWDDLPHDLVQALMAEFSEFAEPQDADHISSILKNGYYGIADDLSVPIMANTAHASVKGCYPGKRRNITCIHRLVDGTFIIKKHRLGKCPWAEEELEALKNREEEEN